MSHLMHHYTFFSFNDYCFGLYGQKLEFSNFQQMSETTLTIADPIIYIDRHQDRQITIDQHKLCGNIWCAEPNSNQDFTLPGRNQKMVVSGIKKLLCPPN